MTMPGDKIRVFFQAEDCIRDLTVTGVQTCALPIYDSGKMIAAMTQLLRQVLIAPPIEDYVVRLVHATQPHSSNGGVAGAPVKQYLRFGSSPRGAQSVILGAKGNALAEGRVHVSYEDVEKVIYPALRHRIILNFQAEAEDVNTDQILAEGIKQVRRN